MPVVSSGWPNIFCQMSRLIIAATPIIINMAHFCILNGIFLFLLAANKCFGKNIRGNRRSALMDLVRVSNMPVQTRAAICLFDKAFFWVNKFKVKAVITKTATFVTQSLDSEAAI